jgi:hypothetical protein
MYVPRRLKLAPEYKESLAAIRDRRLPDFDGNLRAVRGLAKFEPEAATRIENSELRIAQAYDQANGYSLALYFEGTATSAESRLIRLEVFEIEPDFYPWDV